MQTGWFHTSPKGHWRILQDASGLWRVWFDVEDLGAYQTPETALAALLAGETYWPASNVEPASEDLPTTLDDWHRMV